MTSSRKRLLYLCIYAAMGAILLTLALNAIAKAHPPYGDSCSLTLNVVGSGVVTSDPDLRVEIAPDNSYVILENSQIKVEYGPFFENHSQFAIRKLYIKSAGNQNQVGSQYLDADAGRGPLTSASIVYDGADRKTVRLEWNDKNNSPTEKIIHEVSIFPNSKVIKIDYIDVEYGINTVDLGRPGGTDNGTHVAYGGGSWIRDYVTLEYNPTVGSYYNRYPPDGVNDPVDGGSLNYNGHFIAGVYNPGNGVGFARVMPVADIEILKLLLRDDQRRGFEIFPYPFFQSHAPFTGYLYAVTGGAAEILSMGQQLADGNYGQFDYECDDDVELTAIPDSGWVFTGWNGDLSGSTNPERLTITGDQVVTATFTLDTSAYTLTVASVGSGTFSVEPNQPDYSSGEVITLTATADPSWRFSGWSGDLSGRTNPETLTITGDSVVTATFTIASFPVIDVWYGSHQVFGHPGNAQQWVNILGNASDPDGITSLTYSLRDGPELPLSIGPDTRRLAFEGDFNVEIDYTDLISGLNQVVITATDILDDTTVETVTVEYTSDNIWPLPYSIGWSPVTNIQDVVQVVDGQWAPVSGGVRTAEVGYDRVLAIGDVAWDDYEVTVPITIHAIDLAGYEWPSVSPGFGLTLRWMGHTDLPVSCEQPHCGWLPSGAGGWYDIGYNGPLILDGLEDPTVTINVGDTFYWKMRVETIPGTGPLYSLKVWENGQPEPSGWNLTKQRGLTDMASGSLILVAHHVDATFGDVTVVPPADITCTLTVNIVGNGSVDRDPDQSEHSYGQPEQSEYNYGQVVTLTATPDSGWNFADWSGDLSGDANPTTLTMTSDKVVTAMFAEPPMIVSDDFNVCTLDTGVWEFINPAGDGTLTMTGEQVLLSVPVSTTHDVWGPESGPFDYSVPRIMQSVDDTDFELEVKFDSGVSLTYQQQGVLIEEDDNNVLRLEFLGRDSKTHIFAAKAEDGISSNIGGWGRQIADGNVAPLYMRVKRVGDQWTQSYSFDKISWTPYVTFTHTISVTAAGVYVGNGTEGGISPSHTAAIDYFYNTANPGPGDVNENALTLALEIVGSGTVAKDPDQTPYACGEVVTLTATANPSWSFTGWDGDLSGSDNPETLIMDDHKVITATFTQDEDNDYQIFLPIITLQYSQ